MFTDNTLKPIQPDQQYVAPDGTQYPGNWPKDKISGLTPVTATEKPSDPDLVVTGFFINTQREQVWLTRPKTEQEKGVAQLEKRQHALAERWPDAFSLLDDILNRGLEAVKLDRDEIKAANPKV